jgi:uncharacterized protein YecE (DUF72 family)
MSVQRDLFGFDPNAAVSARVGPAETPPEWRYLAETLPPAVRLGTSSWSFPGWAGLVYAGKATARELSRDGLHAYASHGLFRTVGIDRSYYRAPERGWLETYKASVPRGFRFLIKAPRDFLLPFPVGKGPDSAENGAFLDAKAATELFVRPVQTTLGDAAGPLVFQFPPTDFREIGGLARFSVLLARFLGEMPVGPLYVVEVRHPSLVAPEIKSVVEENGALWGYSVHSRMPPLETQLRTLPRPEGAPLVVRWSLRRNLSYRAGNRAFEPFDRLRSEDPAVREVLAMAIRSAMLDERDVFVVANNKAEGCAPLTLVKLAQAVLEQG